MLLIYLLLTFSFLEVTSSRGIVTLPLERRVVPTGPQTQRQHQNHGQFSASATSEQRRKLRLAEDFCFYLKPDTPDDSAPKIPEPQHPMITRSRTRGTPLLFALMSICLLSGTLADSSFRCPKNTPNRQVLFAESCRNSSVAVIAYNTNGVPRLCWDFVTYNFGHLRFLQLHDQSTILVKELHVQQPQFDDSDPPVCLDLGAKLTPYSKGLPVVGSSGFCTAYGCSPSPSTTFFILRTPPALFVFSNFSIPIAAWGHVLRPYYPFANSTASSPTPPITIVCSIGGLRFFHTVADFVHACIGASCVHHAAYTDGEAILFPTSLVIFDYTVHVRVWKSRLLISSSTQSCRGRSICETIQCIACVEHLWNPQCWTLQDGLLSALFFLASTLIFIFLSPVFFLLRLLQLIGSSIVWCRKVYITSWTFLPPPRLSFSLDISKSLLSLLPLSPTNCITLRLRQFSLPAEMLLISLFRMSSKELCRMRRTCKFLDDFVKTFERKFSSRPHLGVFLSVCADYKSHNEIRISTFQSDTYFVAGDNLAKHMSAVSIKYLRVTFAPEEDSLLPLLLNTLKSLPQCISSWVNPSTSEEHLAAIVDSINVKKEIITNISYNKEAQFMPLLSKEIDGSSATFFNLSNLKVKFPVGKASILKFPFTNPSTSLPFQILWEMPLTQKDYGTHDIGSIYLLDLKTKYAVFVNSYTIYQRKPNEIEVSIHFLERLPSVVAELLKEMGLDLNIELLLNEAQSSLRKVPQMKTAREKLKRVYNPLARRNTPSKVAFHANVKHTQSSSSNASQSSVFTNPSLRPTFRPTESKNHDVFSLI